MIALYILEWIIIVLLVFIAALLAIPFKYYASGTKYDTYSIDLELSWLFGAMRFTLAKKEGMKAEYFIKLFGLRFYFNPKTSKGEEKTEKSKWNTADLLNKEFLKKLITAFADIIKHIRPKRFILSARYGFYDPCDTGMLCAFLSRIRLPHDNVSINLNPVFEDEILEGRLLLQGRLIIAVIAVIAIRLLLSSPARNILKNIFKKRRETKLYVS